MNRFCQQERLEIDLTRIPNLNCSLALIIPFLCIGFQTVEEVGREFQRQLNHSTNTPISASFQQYSAYGYDLTVALGLLFDKVVKQLVNQNKTEKLHNFNYEDPFLVNLIDEILKREPFIIEGLTVRQVISYV